ncbi:hypothetical protein HOF65_04720 [bacterium]|jgi:hypothetical protein|nr:hypothetical protein [bacterium]MBT3853261.1 hypothetical protein [bacterium]MBT4633745.1 hypothetical protein [bacterium]MBT5491056.1 hypothetical protein [bacterium]
MYLFRKFSIIELIDKLNIEFDDIKVKEDVKKIIEPKKKKISDKIKINEITAKAISYYVFLVFFRLAIVVIGITEIEVFM